MNIRILLVLLCAGTIATSTTRASESGNSQLITTPATSVSTSTNPVAISETALDSGDSLITNMTDRAETACSESQTTATHGETWPCSFDTSMQTYLLRAARSNNILLFNKLMDQLERYQKESSQSLKMSSQFISKFIDDSSFCVEPWSRAERWFTIGMGMCWGAIFSGFLPQREPTRNKHLVRIFIGAVAGSILGFFKTNPHTEGQRNHNRAHMLVRLVDSPVCPEIRYTREQQVKITLAREIVAGR